MDRLEGFIYPDETTEGDGIIITYNKDGVVVQIED